MSEKRIKRLILLSVCLAVTLIVANLSALKIWSAWGVPVDAGILLFPLSYIAGDLLAEFYGEKIANFAALVAAAFGVITLFTINLANCLPNYPGADNSGFDAVSTLAGRIFLASIISFLLGQIANNRVFDSIRHKRGLTKIGHGPLAEYWRQKAIEAEPVPEKIADKKFLAAFAQRALISSGIAHAVDAVVFEVIAFYGKLPLPDFITQILWAYALGLVLELLFFPLTYFLAYEGRSTP